MIKFLRLTTQILCSSIICMGCKPDNISGNPDNPPDNTYDFYVETVLDDVFGTESFSEVPLSVEKMEISMHTKSNSNVKLSYVSTADNVHLFGGNWKREQPDKDIFYASCPFDVRSLVDRNMQLLKFPSVQNDNYAFWPMVAKAEVQDGKEVRLQMSNLFSVLMLDITGNGDKLKGVTVSGNSGEDMAGYLRMAVDGDLQWDKPVKMIEFSLSDGVFLSDKPSKVFMAIPPGTYAKGLKVTIYTDRTEYSLMTENNLVISKDALKRMTANIPSEDKYSYSMAERYESTFEWSDAERDIKGWDWSLPSWVEAEKTSGMIPTSNGSWFKGNRIYNVNVSWRDLEPKEGQYNINLLKNAISSALTKIGPKDFLMISIMGSVWKTHYKDGTWSWGTVPEWMGSKSWFKTDPKIVWVNVTPSFYKENADIYRPQFHEKFKGLMSAIRENGCLDNDRIGLIMIHERSYSGGEEADSPAQGTRNFAIWQDRINVWCETVGAANTGKLVSMHAEPPYVTEFIKRGAGTRSGFSEMYLLRMQSPELGQYIDDEGYLCVDESVPLIANHQASGDDNEEYVVGKHEVRFGPKEHWPHRHHEASLRILQMRRTYLQAYYTYPETPGNTHYEGMASVNNMANFVSFELGKTVDNTPDVWCYLRKCYINGENGDPKETRHYERWLYNRDTKGFVPVYSEIVEIPKNSDGGWCRGRHPNYFYDYTARKTDISGGNNGISFDVDERWLKGNPRNVYVKVTYTDRGEATLQLRCRNASGQEIVKEQRCGNTGHIRTVTFLLENVDFTDRMSIDGHKMDFAIFGVDGDVSVNFVRVIKQSNN